jgi:Tfp pilus assembly protein PilF
MLRAMASGKTALQWRREGAQAAQAKEWKRALDAFEHAIAIAPDDALAWLNKATVLQELGKREAALHAIERAAAIAPADAAIQRALDRARDLRT